LHNEQFLRHIDEKSDVYLKSSTNTNMSWI